MEARERARVFLEAIGREGSFSEERLNELLGRGTRVPNAQLGASWEFASPLGNFEIAERTGDIISYSLAETAREEDMQITAAEAGEIAARIVQRVYPDFQSRRLEQKAVEALPPHFQVEFEQKQPPDEVSIYRNFITVLLRGDNGGIAMYSCSNFDFVRKDPVPVTEADAREIVEGVVGPKGGVIDTIVIGEVPVDEGTRAVTVWKVGVSFGGDGPTSWSDVLMVNADTGEPFEF